MTVSGLTLSGADGGNYTLTSTTATTTADITAVSLTPAVTAANKVYDGTMSATLTQLHADGRRGRRVVTLHAARAAFDTASVGTGKTVTASGLALTARRRATTRWRARRRRRPPSITAVSLTRER